MIQLQALNYLLQTKDEDFLAKEGLTRDFFSDYKPEFDFIKRHYEQYGQIPDRETFLKTFPNFDLANVAEPRKYLLEELYKDKKQNYLISVTNKLRELVMSNKINDASLFVLDAAEQLSGSQKLEATNIIEDISRYDSYVDRCKDFSKYYVTTGFRALDVSLGGGIDRQNAYFVISARAGVGKTLIMTKMAAASVEKGLRVGMFEGEMTTEKIGYRFDSINSKISSSAISKGKAYVANEYKNYLDNLKTTEGKFFIMTPNDVPGGTVTVDVLEQFVKKYKLDILFVDQISLMDDMYRAKQSFEQAANISKGLKQLQVRNKIPIVVASQQNRASLQDGKMAGTENLSLSDRIGQDATIVLFISRDENLFKFNIAKARDGCIQNELNYVIENMDKPEVGWSIEKHTDVGYRALVEGEKLLDMMASDDSLEANYVEPKVDYYDPSVLEEVF